MVMDLHREAVKVIESGETLETFRARVGPWLERRGWKPPAQGGSVPHRLARIYRTNMRSARAAGQWERIQRTRDLLPYLVYSLGPSQVHRDQHVAWAGLILPVDDPWWNTHFPPNGWGCKCRVRQVSERERDRLLAREEGGFRAEAPEVRTREWVNPATGDVRRVAEGVDPGWDYNPGAHRTLGIHRRLTERTERMVEGRGVLPGVAPDARARLAAESIRGHLTGPGFRWYVERPRPAAPPRWDSTREAEAFPVGILPAGVLPGAASRVVRLPENIADKQWRRHGPGRGGRRERRDVETPLGWYEDVQRMLERISPAPDPRHRDRWRFDDVAGGRRLVIGLDHEGRPIVFSLHPHRFGRR